MTLDEFRKKLKMGEFTFTYSETIYIAVDEGGNDLLIELGVERVSCVGAYAYCPRLKQTTYFASSWHAGEYPIIKSINYAPITPAYFNALAQKKRSFSGIYIQCYSKEENGCPIWVKITEHINMQTRTITL